MKKNILIFMIIVFSGLFLTSCSSSKIRGKYALSEVTVLGLYENNAIGPVPNLSEEEQQEKIKDIDFTKYTVEITKDQITVRGVIGLVVAGMNYNVLSNVEYEETFDYKTKLTEGNPDAWKDILKDGQETGYIVCYATGNEVVYEADYGTLRLILVYEKLS